MAVVAQMFGFSFCMVQSDTLIWSNVVDIIQITLGAVMCLLIAAQFIRESLQMYKATKQFQPNRYLNLLVREGMIYFLTYVRVPSFLAFHFHCTKLTVHYYDIASWGWRFFTCCVTRA